MSGAQQPGGAASSSLRDDPAGVVFAALADPTRRHVVRTLATGTSATASGLAGELPMSRQAVAKHLEALEHAGLVDSVRAGRERVWSLDGARIAQARALLEQVSVQWDARLERLRALVE